MVIDKNYKVAKFFTFKEMIHSETAEKMGIDNSPKAMTIILNLIKLTNRLDLVRAHIDAPITINSGYRCEKVNDMIGGVKKSLHTKGKAADISFSKKEDYEKALQFLKKYKELLMIDEIIPHKTYIHVGIY